MSKLPAEFLSEFDLKVIADRHGVVYTLGLNGEAAWISERPTSHASGTSARQHAERIPNRVVFVTRESLQPGRSPKLMAAIIRPDPKQCVFQPLPAGLSTASVLLSYLGAFQDWPEVSTRLNADRAARGLPLLTPETIG